MLSTFRVIGLSSVDPDGSDTRGEPELSYPDALKTARELKAQGKAFRVIPDGPLDDQQREAFAELGALI